MARLAPSRRRDGLLNLLGLGLVVASIVAGVPPLGWAGLAILAVNVVVSRLARRRAGND